MPAERGTDRVHSRSAVAPGGAKVRDATRREQQAPDSREVGSHLGELVPRHHGDLLSTSQCPPVARARPTPTGRLAWCAEVGRSKYGSVTSPELTEFIRGIPKVELHVHIEGTLEPELKFALAERNRMALPYADVAASAAYAFDDLPSFLACYYEGMGVLQTAEDFADLARAYLRRAHEQNVRYAEIFFDPQAHTSRGCHSTSSGNRRRLLPGKICRWTKGRTLAMDALRSARTAGLRRSRRSSRTSLTRDSCATTPSATPTARPSNRRTLASLLAILLEIEVR